MPGLSATLQAATEVDENILLLDDDCWTIATLARAKMYVEKEVLLGRVHLYELRNAIRDDLGQHEHRGLA